MAQESGLHFKLLYPNWYRNHVTVALPNGLLPYTVAWITDLLNHHIGPIELDDIDRPISLNPFYRERHNCIMFRHADLYRHFKLTFGSHHIVSLDDLDDSNTLYFYPIEIEGDRFRYIWERQEYSTSSGKSEYLFKNTFSDKVLDLIKQGRVKVVISYMVDPVERLEFINRCEEELNSIGIASENIIMLSGNIDYNYKGKMLLLDSIISLYQTSHTIPLYPFQTSLGYVSDYVKVEDLDRNIIRPKKFLSFNRNMNNPHRPAWCWSAMKHNLLSEGYFSFLCNLNYGVDHMLGQILPDDDLDNIDSKVSAIKNLIPYELDTQHVENKLGFTTNENNKKEYYINSYWHITTETEFTNSKSPFFSEKTWRPILNLQPFIYLGNPGSLRKLKDLGFQTFEPFIDESYDNVSDIKIRYNMILQEILKLHQMSLEDINEMYFKLLDRLIHNQQLLKNKTDYNPITKLISYEFRK